MMRAAMLPKNWEQLKAIMANNGEPATKDYVVSQAWLARAEADFDIAKARPSSLLAARRKALSTLEDLDCLTCTLASDAAILKEFAAGDNLVNSSTDVDIADLMR